VLSGETVGTGLAEMIEEVENGYSLVIDISMTPVSYSSSRSMLQGASSDRRCFTPGFQISRLKKGVSRDTVQCT